MAEMNVKGKHILENARVYGKSYVHGNAVVTEDAVVFGNAQVYGDAWVRGDAKIGGTARILGGAWDGSEGEITEGTWIAPGVPYEKSEAS
jgi:UDP-3-O-[3-hydroxymyristoyl] glucosamine N-acyltransferase